MKTVNIHTQKPYQVHIGNGCLVRTGALVRNALPGAARAAIVTDSHVGPLYLEKTTESFRKNGFEVVGYMIEAGEKSKNIQTYTEILSFLASEHITRSDCVIALGGGVVGDLAGFAAASYLRGIPYIQIPTSLLAMVDSSVGGKTAIDLPEGKNLAGAFYQPEAVICDPQLLKTLPEDVFRDGCAEVIKYGILEDRDMFYHLSESGMAFNPEEVIARCIEIKGEYVSRDEKDNGDRRKLNLGHTFGHAIEAASHYGMTHGQAVAAGMCIIARAAAERKLCSMECAQMIRSCVDRFDLPTGCDYAANELTVYIGADKKRRGHEISLIVPERIGKCSVFSVPVEECTEWLRQGLTDGSED